LPPVLGGDKEEEFRWQFVFFRTANHASVLGLSSGDASTDHPVIPSSPFSRYALYMQRWLVISLLSLALVTLACAQTKPRRIDVEGHRGARWVLPENTMPAMMHAIEAGADVLEIDLWVTKDNVPVISHDAKLNPTFCDGPEGLTRVIRELTVAEVKQFDCGARANPGFPTQKAVPGTRVPTFDEFFTQLAKYKKIRYNVEIKMDPRNPALSPSPEEFSRLVVDVIRKHKLTKRVKVQSFVFPVLHAMKKIAPEIHLSALIGSEQESFVETSKRAGGAPTVSPNYRLVTPEKVKEAHAAGLRIVAWTPNQPEDWQPLIDAGVDAIITDDPKGLVEYLKARNLH